MHILCLHHRKKKIAVPEKREMGKEGLPFMRSNTHVLQRDHAYNRHADMEKIDCIRFKNMETIPYENKTR